MVDRLARTLTGLFAFQVFKVMKSQELEENPFGDNMPINYLQRQTVPESGEHERALLGYLTLLPVEDVILIGDVLHDMDIQYPFHAALYRSILRHARKGTATLEAIADGVDRWLWTDVGYQQPRRYLGFAIGHACANYEEAALCIDWIQECAARRRRYDAAKKVLELCTNVDKKIDQIDTATNALFRTARRVNQGLTVTPGTAVTTIEKSGTAVPFKENPRYAIGSRNTESRGSPGLVRSQKL